MILRSRKLYIFTIIYIRYYVAFSNIIWNGSPLSLRREGNGDRLALGGNGIHWYQNLPTFLSDKMPMYGNQAPNTGDRNSVSIPSKCTVYMLRVDGWWDVDVSGWTKVSTGSYISNYPNAKLYEKLYDAGDYVFDDLTAMYLFDLGKFI